MHEYQSNLDSIDIFHLLTLNHPEESEFISLPSPISQPSHFHLQPEHNLLQDKLEVPTTHKTEHSLPNAAFHDIGHRLARKKCIDFRWQVKKQCDLARQGSKDDTVELNINFKTILFNHFKELLLVNELPPQQAQLVLQFGARSPSFKSLQAFFARRGSGITKHCSAMVGCSLIIRRILQSRCRMATKMQMIKFVEVLRANINGCGNIRRWKAGRK